MDKKKKEIVLKILDYFLLECGKVLILSLCAFSFMGTAIISLFAACFLVQNGHVELVGLVFILWVLLNLITTGAYLQVSRTPVEKLFKK